MDSQLENCLNTRDLRNKESFCGCWIKLELRMRSSKSASIEHRNWTSQPPYLLGQEQVEYEA